MEMRKKKPLRIRHQRTLVPMGMFGPKQESASPPLVDYSHVAKAVENSELNGDDGTGEVKVSNERMDRGAYSGITIQSVLRDEQNEQRPARSSNRLQDR